MCLTVKSTLPALPTGHLRQRSSTPLPALTASDTGYVCFSLFRNTSTCDRDCFNTSKRMSRMMAWIVVLLLARWCRALSLILGQQHGCNWIALHAWRSHGAGHRGLRLHRTARSNLRLHMAGHRIRPFHSAGLCGLQFHRTTSSSHAFHLAGHLTR